MTNFNVGDLLMFGAFKRLGYIKHIEENIVKNTSEQALSVVWLTPDLVYKNVAAGHMTVYFSERMKSSINNGCIDHYKVNKQSDI
jgi:hypothetical protein